MTTRLQADLPLVVPTAAGEQTLLGRMVGLPSDGQPVVGRVETLSGGSLDGRDPEAVLVEKHMADHFDLAPSDTLEVLMSDGPRTLTVAGVVASPEYLWPAADRQEVITTPDEFGVVFASNDLVAEAPGGTQVHQTLVSYDDSARRAVLDAELSAAARDAGATDIMTKAEQPSNAALDEDLAAFGELSFMFPALFLSGAGLATFIILNRMVAAQRGQIGALLASGLSRREVMRHYRGYGLVLGLARRRRRGGARRPPRCLDHIDLHAAAVHPGHRGALVLDDSAHRSGVRPGNGHRGVLGTGSRGGSRTSCLWPCEARSSTSRTRGTALPSVCCRRCGGFPCATGSPCAGSVGTALAARPRSSVWFSRSCWCSPRGR